MGKCVVMEINNKKNRLRTRLTISTDVIADILFVIFYSMSFFEWVFGQILGVVNATLFASTLILIMLYMMVLLLVVTSRKYLKLDFIGLCAFIIVFFFITYIFHPEYEYVYMRRQYGVWDYVLSPGNGLYAYLFVRLVDNPQKLIKNLKLSGYFIYAYSALRLYLALRRGYWFEEDYLGHTIHLSYNLNFGFNLVIFVCCFLYCALKDKSLKDFVLAVLGIVMIFLGGSRGPLLDIAIFLAIYILITAGESRNKFFCLLIIILGTIIICLTYRQILIMVANILTSLNLSSRTIVKLLEGSIAEDNGRAEIWAAALNMIKENPFGYGAMGARHVLYHIHIVGHPHNVFLEIFVDYGVIIGSIMIIAFFVKSIRIFVAKNLGEWKYVYLIFFAYACQLLTSYTYWHSTGLWAVLAVGVCISLRSTGRKNGGKIIHGRQ